MITPVVVCGNEKCNHTIAVSNLSSIKLKVIRHYKTLCDKCGMSTRWMETATLFTVETKIIKVNGGSEDGGVNFRDH